MTQPWFSVRPLGSDTWAISEPEHWEQPHCYLLLGQKQALLIDTGLGAAPLRPVVRSLTDLPVLAALEELAQAGRLAHGQGILDYGSFRLHL